MQLLQAVADPVEREHYVDMLSKLTGASREAVAQRLAQLDNGETEVPRRLKAVKTTELADAREQMQQDYLLALMTVDDGAAREVEFTGGLSDRQVVGWCGHVPNLDMPGGYSQGGAPKIFPAAA